MTAERQPVFSDPEDQARHEQNLKWLRLMKEDPGWVLSRLHVLAALEEGVDKDGHRHYEPRWNLREIEMWMKALGFLPDDIGRAREHLEGQ